MRTFYTGRVGVIVAAVAIGVLGAGCVPRLPLPLGTASGPAPATARATASLHLSPSPAKFPSTPPPYWPMPIVKVTVTNAGNTTIKSVVVHPVSVYSVPSNTCTTLKPGQRCAARVQFCPTSPGRYVDVLAVTGKNAKTGKPVSARVTLSGTAT